MTLPTYDGYFDPWLDRAFPGIEELAREMEVPRCDWCDGTGRIYFGAVDECARCDGTGLALELGVAG